METVIISNAMNFLKTIGKRQIRETKIPSGLVSYYYPFHFIIIAEKILAVQSGR
jgi:hypothetical protein